MTAEEIAAYKVDRTGWESGEWDNEPDRVDFGHVGFACLLLRNHHGAWCGYVGLPASHALYGKPYQDVDVEVHGGLTYSAKCAPPICHVPQSGEDDDVFWLGFDCHHAWDIAPGFEAREAAIGLGPLREPYSTYRTMDYARREVERLADQLKAIG